MIGLNVKILCVFIRKMPEGFQGIQNFHPTWIFAGENEMSDSQKSIDFERSVNEHGHCFTAFVIFALYLSQLQNGIMMYAYISGKLVEKTPAYVVVDVQGIGYHLHISLNTFTAIQPLESAKLYTYFSVREDAQQLYGFFDEEERSLFLHLISVSGVGANTARVILSSLSTHEAIEAIASGNAAALQRVKGIGAKTAQRIVVDLRDKVGKLPVIGQKTGSSYNTNKEEALSALLVLGFNKAAADKVLAKIVADNPSLAVDKLIREALRVL